MLNDWFKKLQEELDALTEVDLKRVGINLGKPNKEDAFVVQLSEELQKLWTLIGRKEREVKKLTYEHFRDCKKDEGEDCKAFSEKCLIIVEDTDILRKMFEVSLRRQLTEDQRKSIKRKDIYISRDFKVHSMSRKTNGMPSEMISDIMGLMTGGGILIQI